MTAQKIALQEVEVERHVLNSLYLDRPVLLDVYLPPAIRNYNELSLLLVNDGQDLVTMKFENILDGLFAAGKIQPIFCVGIHCSSDRKNEYGTARITDYKGRGARAHLYTAFIMLELIPFIRKAYNIFSFKDKSFAGFSLGGLCALDIVWNQFSEFKYAGVFSGSFWWRDKAQDDPQFDEDSHRIMQRQIREGSYIPWLKFFFEVGTKDELQDRNNNGVIDSIDDTKAVIKELEKKGYREHTDIKYVQIEDGYHDVPTWARAFPDFLTWAWGLNTETTD